MVRVSVFYPSRPDSRFNADYYIDTHMPLVLGLLGAAVKAVTVEFGLYGGMPGQAPPFTAICNFTCESVDAFTSAFLPNASVVESDIPNYTDIEPLIQISEIRMEQ